MRFAISIGKAKRKDLPNIRKLIRKTFDDFIAPEYPQRGRETLYKETELPELKKRYNSGELFLVAKENDRLVGSIEISNNNHIRLLFVDKRYQNKKIGTKLIKKSFEALKVYTKFVTVQATPNAVNFYQKIGFIKTGRKTIKRGLIFIPMKIQLY